MEEQSHHGEQMHYLLTKNNWKQKILSFCTQSQVTFKFILRETFHNMSENRGLVMRTTHSRVIWKVQAAHHNRKEMTTG